LLALRLESTTSSNILGESSDAVSLREGGAGSGFCAETVSESLYDLALLDSFALPSLLATGGKVGVCGGSVGRAGRGLSSLPQK
jgi:hypothetical protein